MRKCAVRSVVLAKQPRSYEGPRIAVRYFHQTTSRAAEQDPPNSDSRNPTSVRSRSATNAAKVWEQVRQLPDQSNTRGSGQVAFNDAVRAFGGRSVEGSMSQGRPREFRPRDAREGEIRDGRPGDARDGRPGDARDGRPRETRPIELVRRLPSAGATMPREVVRKVSRPPMMGSRDQFGQDRGRSDQAKLQSRSRPPRPRRNMGPRRKQGRGGAAADGDDDDDAEDDWEEYTGYYQLFTSDDYVENFVTLEEAQSYARLQEFVDEYDQAFSLVAMTANDIIATGKEDAAAVTATLDTDLEQWDDDISEALEHLVETDEKAYPRHEPQPFAVESLAGTVGDVPIGPGSTGRVVEDGLRYLSERDGLLYQHPKELAQRLVAGEFVRFRNPFEKGEVLHLAEELAYRPDAPDSTENCGFEEPSQAAKELLVKRLAGGTYVDPRDDGLRAEALRNAARIASGNASYPAKSKNALLDTIRALLPSERAAQGPRRAA